MTVGQLIAILMRQPRSLEVMLGGAPKTENGEPNILFDIVSAKGYTICDHDRLANFKEKEERQPGTDDLVFTLWP